MLSFRNDTEPNHQCIAPYHARAADQPFISRITKYAALNGTHSSSLCQSRRCFRLRNMDGYMLASLRYVLQDRKQAWRQGDRAHCRQGWTLGVLSDRETI